MPKDYLIPLLLVNLLPPKVRRGRPTLNAGWDEETTNKMLYWMLDLQIPSSEMR